MVSSSHEAMHRIFQEDPGIFARSFTRLNIPFEDPVAVSLLPSDLTELRPLERRLDTLLQVDTADGGSYLLAVEAQGKKDPQKHSSWAYYAAHLYAKYRKPPVLLIVCQDEATARWAETPFHVGIPHWRTLTVRPLVLGPHNVPVITDSSSAAEDIPLAVFSAITHGRHPRADTMLSALAEALKKADADTADLFKELTELGLGTAPAAQIWRDLMTIPTSFFRSETAERVRQEGRERGQAEGREEGRAEGRVLGRAEGREQGQAEGRVMGRAEARTAVAMESLAKHTLLALRVRGVEVPEAVRERVMACDDADALRTWFSRAVTAERAEEIFGTPQD